MFLFHLRRPLLAIRRIHLDHPGLSASRCLAAATIAIGLYGQYLDSTAAVPPASWRNVHTLFGVALYCAVAARLLAERPPDRGCVAAASCQLGRRLSRHLYLLLYGLVGVGIALARSTGPHGYDAFQPYLAHGVVALLLIRMGSGALSHHHRSIRLRVAGRPLVARRGRP